MPNPWSLLTGRGKVFLVVGIAVGVLSVLLGHRDLLWLALLLVLLPLATALVVGRSQLRLALEREVTPSQVAIGEPLIGSLVVEKTGRLPAGILRFEDFVPRELGSRPRFTIQTLASQWHREIRYPLLGRTRGRFHTGPLMVRTSDPFGLAYLDRQFTATSEVMVTPQIVPLGGMANAGGGGNSGESRPHRLGSIGQDDVVVREYRAGDDFRRVHWRSTARRGELMVRREEQAWDPSATVVIDTRHTAHGGRGKDSSFEWCVSAAASVALHFLDNGYAVNLLEPRGPVTLQGMDDAGAVTTRHNVVHKLTDIDTSEVPDLKRVVDVTAVNQAGQLMVAVMGRLTMADVQMLAQTRRNRAQAMAIVLDADSFAPRGERAERADREEMERAVQALRDHQWRVVPVRRGTSVQEAWQALERMGELV